MWKRKRSWLLIHSLMILLTTTIIMVMMRSLVAPKPPLKEFIKYEKILETAPTISDDNMYRQQIIAAEHFRKVALSEWQQQDSRWLFLRNYNEARRMMILAISIVEEVSSGSTPQNTEPSGIPTHIIWPNDDSVTEFPEK